MGFYWAMFLTVLLTAGIMIAVVFTVVSVYSFFFEAPLWFVQWAWNHKVLRWRYVETDEFDKNFCTHCGSRLTVSFSKEYSEIDGRAKHAEAYVSCRKGGIYGHGHFKTEYPPASTSRKVNYKVKKFTID